MQVGFSLSIVLPEEVIGLHVKDSLTPGKLLAKSKEQAKGQQDVGDQPKSPACVADCNDLATSKRQVMSNNIAVRYSIHPSSRIRVRYNCSSMKNVSPAKGTRTSRIWVAILIVSSMPFVCLFSESSDFPSQRTKASVQPSCTAMNRLAFQRFHDVLNPRALRLPGNLTASFFFACLGLACQSPRAKHPWHV